MILSNENSFVLNDATKKWIDDNKGFEFKSLLSKNPISPVTQKNLAIQMWDKNKDLIEKTASYILAIPQNSIREAHGKLNITRSRLYSLKSNAVKKKSNIIKKQRLINNNHNDDDYYASLILSTIKYTSTEIKKIDFKHFDVSNPLLNPMNENANESENPTKFFSIAGGNPTFFNTLNEKMNSFLALNETEKMSTLALDNELLSIPQI